jgi:hypothetical protein
MLSADSQAVDIQWRADQLQVQIVGNSRFLK